MKKSFVLLTAATGLVAGSAFGSIVTYQQVDGTPYQTPALATADTYGNNMVGMEITVTFSDGSTQQAAWATTGSEKGAATVAGFFDVLETGDTFDENVWALQDLSSSLSIDHVTFFGPSGDTIFDRTFGNQDGTPGSGGGRDFAMSGGNFDITATYSDIVNLTGFPAVGDEFAQVDLDFGNKPFGPGTSEAFSLDTDSAATKGTITVVPEPSQAMAGALLLAPFVLQGLRRLCKRG